MVSLLPVIFFSLCALQGLFAEQQFSAAVMPYDGSNIQHGYDNLFEFGDPRADAEQTGSNESAQSSGSSNLFQKFPQHLQHLQQKAKNKMAEEKAKVQGFLRCMENKGMKDVMQSMAERATEALKGTALSTAEATPEVIKTCYKTAVLVRTFHKFMANMQFNMMTANVLSPIIDICELYKAVKVQGPDLVEQVNKTVPLVMGNAKKDGENWSQFLKEMKHGAKFTEQAVQECYDETRIENESQFSTTSFTYGLNQPNENFSPEKKPYPTLFRPKRP